MTQPYFVVEGLQAGYGGKQVLFDVHLSLNQGEILSVVGRNGMGKTTTLRSILGLNPPWRGSIKLEGRELHGLTTTAIARSGIGYVPEGRQLFPNLTVREHLLLAHSNYRSAPAPWTPDLVFKLFPRLDARRNNYGTQLSGGEQQMVAIGRALVTNPRLLLLDEATEGLAPLLRQEIWQCLEMLKGRGQSVIVIDKNINMLMRLAERHAIIEKGRTVWSGTSAELQAATEVQTRYLAV
jgi:branched-chain amino acid transport system ATP-binding protein